MIEKFRTRNNRRLLPLYVNGRLTGSQRRRIERWLSADPAARAEIAQLRAVERALRSRGTAAEPPPAVYAKIRTRVRSAGFSYRLQPKVWGLGMLLGVLLAVLAFFAAPPVNVLAWSVQGSEPSAFRIYRADGGDEAAEFRLIGEVPADSTGQYRYVDLWLRPGRTAVYRVEAVAAGGETVTSQVITGNTLAALPGQIALFGAGLIGVYGLAVLYADLRRRTFSPAWMAF